jgi:hypothetical protein
LQDEPGPESRTGLIASRDHWAIAGGEAYDSDFPRAVIVEFGEGITDQFAIRERILMMKFSISAQRRIADVTVGCVLGGMAVAVLVAPAASAYDQFVAG